MNPVRAPWLLRDLPYPMPVFYPVQYVDNVAILNTLYNPMRVNPQVNADRSGSGLSKKVILKHLHVYTEQEKMSEDCEVDVCSICLNEYEKKEKMGRLVCGHRFHADCINSWLLSKNVCRATALTV